MVVEQRVTDEAAVPVHVLMDPAAALVQTVAGQAERVHHCDRVGEFLGSGALEPAEPVLGDPVGAARDILAMNLYGMLYNCPVSRFRH